MLGFLYFLEFFVSLSGKENTQPSSSQDRKLIQVFILGLVVNLGFPWAQSWPPALVLLLTAVPLYPRLPADFPGCLVRFRYRDTHLSCKWSREWKAPRDDAPGGICTWPCSFHRFLDEFPVHGRLQSRRL